MPPLAQIVIFGASGDLTARKLIPALCALSASPTAAPRVTASLVPARRGGSSAEGAFNQPIQVVGVARRAKTDAEWRDELTPWIPEHHRAAWARFRDQVHYVQADSLVATDVKRLGEVLDVMARGVGEGEPGRLFYLALKPSLFGPTVQQLDRAGLLACEPGAAAGWRRVVVEKPFGTDLASAQALNRALLTHLREDQIFRIDHYLGKETVQNILGFRFQNAIFEPLWNREHVESVEISVCETVGMEGGRGAYYDTAGALRDMVQNHVLQVLALIAMEPPSSMAADAVRNEKVKVLGALRPFTPERVARDVVRAQYTAGPARDRGYREEEGVPADSLTESYVAIRASIHNWRWNGVPFFLRTGKCLHRRYTEVILRFRVPPVDLLGGPVDAEICALRPNALRLMIQPQEGFRLSFLVKQPGPGVVMRRASLGFDYQDLHAAPSAPAYQRLLLDAVEGNATLFIRGDETETAWRFADSIRAGWGSDEPTPMYAYPAGGQGPAAANDLFRGCEGTWGDGGDEA